MTLTKCRDCPARSHIGNQVRAYEIDGKSITLCHKCYMNRVDPEKKKKSA